MFYSVSHPNRSQVLTVVEHLLMPGKGSAVGRSPRIPMVSNLMRGCRKRRKGVGGSEEQNGPVTFSHQCCSYFHSLLLVLIEL